MLTYSQILDFQYRYNSVKRPRKNKTKKDTPMKACSLIFLTTLLLFSIIQGKAAEAIQVKPGAFDTHLFTNVHNLNDCSFIIERVSPKTSEISPEERAILLTDESVFQNIYLKDLVAGYYKSRVDIRNEWEPGHKPSRPIKFGEPFILKSVTTNASALVIEIVDFRALAGKYSISVKDKNDKMVSKEEIEILPKYPEVVPLMLELERVKTNQREFIKKIKESLIKQDALESIDKNAE